MQLEKLSEIVLNAAQELKAVDLRVLDVRGKTSITDLMVVASGTSRRHVKSIAESVVMAAKAVGEKPFGVEGEAVGEWVLIDLSDMVVHVMMPETRAFYQLEQLWEVGPDHAGSPPSQAVASGSAS